jgi:hypothetical protein
LIVARKHHEVLFHLLLPARETRFGCLPHRPELR